MCEHYPKAYEFIVERIILVQALGMLGEEDADSYPLRIKFMVEKAA